MYRLIQRSGPPHSFNARLFKTLDEASLAARQGDEDYLIEEAPEGAGLGAGVIKYRLGEFEMG